MGISTVTTGRTRITFQLSESFSDQRKVFWLIDVLLLEPTKVVIGCYHPSSRALLVRTQILVSQANIMTWGVLLRSLLSCLPGLSLTSKGIMRHQPKRFFNPVNQLVVLDQIQHPVSSPNLAGPQPSARRLHWVPMLQLVYNAVNRLCEEDVCPLLFEH